MLFIAKFDKSIEQKEKMIFKQVLNGNFEVLR